MTSSNSNGDTAYFLGAANALDFDDDDDNINDEDDVTAMQDFIAGGLAGSASVIVGHPFDTMKVRLQTSTKPTSLLQAATAFGGASSLFRGMGAPLAGACVVNAIIFSGYGASSRLYDQYLLEPKTTNSNGGNSNDDDDDDEHDPWQKAFLCGSFAGLVQCTVVCPMEHLKCRLQVQHGAGSADNLYSGPVHAARSILKSHGIAGLYRGWWATCLREVPAFGLYFTTYDYIKDNVNSLLAHRDGLVDEDASTPVQHSHTWLASAFAGGASGCLTWAVVYPVDVIKTRISTSPLDTKVSFMGAARAIVQKHGWRMMFRGLGITLIRAFPVNGTIFPVYEFTLEHLSKQ